jgi:hypothetical protein
MVVGFKTIYAIIEVPKGTRFAMGNFHNMVLTYMEPKYGQVQYIDLVGLWSFNSTFNNISAISWR